MKIFCTLEFANFSLFNYMHSGILGKLRNVWPIFAKKWSCLTILGQSGSKSSVFKLLHKIIKSISHLFFSITHMKYYLNFWSLDQRSFETLRDTTIRLFVCTYATLFLGIHSLLFFWNFTLRACKCKKNVPRAFLIIVTIFGLSAISRLRPKESRLSVRPSLRSSVTRYLRICSSELSEIWQLGKTWIGKKCSKRIFDKFFISSNPL